MTHFLAGRKQSPEHIAKRLESVRIAKSLWSTERNEQFRTAVSVSAKGRPAWNKGKLATEEMRRKNSEGHKGLMVGEKNHNFGKPLSLEIRAKIRAANIGKKQSPELIAKRVEGRRGYRHSEETRVKMAESSRGERNGMFGKIGALSPSWLGGPTGYTPEWSFTLREEIRDRDSRECRFCGLPESENFGLRLEVHHIDYDKKNCNPENLVTLCRRCHRKSNYKRTQWRAVLSTRLNGKQLTSG